MSNRFYTLMLIPEKTSKVRRIMIPSWLFKGSLVGLFFLIVLAGIMVLDYWYVIDQIGENKQLKIENRKLRQEVQVFKNKMVTIEETMERVQTFATRLKVITNIEDKDDLVQRLNRENLPEAQANTGNKPQTPDPDLTIEDQSPEEARLQEERKKLDSKFVTLHRDTLVVEQELQDLYELLVDQKSFLAALPTRKPAIGYFTSGFGVRKSPYGGRVKMHEGLDVANHMGTVIRSTAHGKVSFAGRKPGYGKTVIIDHGYGLETWYAHASQILVRSDEKVRRGQQVALMGSTGRSTGSHVHYEVRIYGIPVDPLSYILEN